MCHTPCTIQYYVYCKIFIFPFPSAPFYQYVAASYKYIFVFAQANTFITWKSHNICMYIIIIIFILCLRFLLLFFFAQISSLVFCVCIRRDVLNVHSGRGSVQLWHETIVVGAKKQFLSFWLKHLNSTPPPPFPRIACTPIFVVCE